MESAVGCGGDAGRKTGESLAAAKEEGVFAFVFPVGMVRVGVSGGAIAASIAGLLVLY